MTGPVQLVALASDPALVIDRNQRVLALNAAAEELLGRSAAETVGSSCSDVAGLVLADGEPICKQRCGAVYQLAHCRPYSVQECLARRDDGSRVAVQISSMAIPADPGDREAPVAMIFLHRTGVAEENQTNGRLSIRTLGSFGAAAGGIDLDLDHWPRKQSVQILKYLTVRVGHAIHREELIDMLWPDCGDERNARQRLKVAVHFLRSKLREVGLTRVIVTEGSTYVLDIDSVWIDAQRFERCATDGNTHECHGRSGEAIKAFEEAHKLFRGDFLETDRYADWCAEERARLAEIHLDVLIRLAGLLHAKGDHAAAAQVCHSALVVEPCRENVHRLLMRSLMALNRIDRVVAQYRRCRQILREELGVDPAPETEHLLQSLTAKGIAVTS